MTTTQAIELLKKGEVQIKKDDSHKADCLLFELKKHNLEMSEIWYVNHYLVFTGDSLTVRQNSIADAKVINASDIKPKEESKELEPIDFILPKLERALVKGLADYNACKGAMDAATAIMDIYKVPLEEREVKSCTYDAVSFTNGEEVEATNDLPYFENCKYLYVGKNPNADSDYPHVVMTTDIMKSFYVFKHLRKPQPEVKALDKPTLLDVLIVAITKVQEIVSSEVQLVINDDAFSDLCNENGFSKDESVFVIGCRVLKMSQVTHIMDLPKKKYDSFYIIPVIQSKLNAKIIV